MHQNYFRGGMHLRERIGNGLLARVASVNHSCRAAEGSFSNFVLQRNDIVGARRDEKVCDLRTGGQTPQCKNHKRHAIQFQELLGHFGAHAGAESSSGNNGGYATHRRANSLSQLRTKGEKTVAGLYPTNRVTAGCGSRGSLYIFS